MSTGAVHELPVRRRHLAIDERGIGLRATWHFDRRMVNLSLWRDDRCVETFHLQPGEAAALVDFLVTGLADAMAPPVPHLSLASAPPPPTGPRAAVVAGLSDSLVRLRRDVAGALDRAAARLRR